ncbi:hypothetical protein [Laspinema olomoucense]|uniref:hypothetical protein n=1 Tax=Laspinema olomoucense TaxID=3231600 RepID=UPI0021BADE8A|nr:hypothetical protein [Laspinema sp. D3a]MCT7989036.1 hypothetical protein [Laspinema sp. D3a]
MKSNNNPQNLLDKHGKPLTGAALQSRLNALEKQRFKQEAREYLSDNPPYGWTELDVEEKIPVLVALEDLFTEHSLSSALETIDLKTIDMKRVEIQKTKIKWSDLAIFKIIKSSGYICAISGGMILVFMLIRGGELKEVKEASATFAAGITLVKFCYDQEKNEKLDNNS